MDEHLDSVDEHLDSVKDLATRIQKLIDSTDKPKQVDEHKVITKSIRIGRLQKCLWIIDEALKALVGHETDTPSLKQHDEQL